MTVVLVHGNPETDAVWGPMVSELGRDDVVRLSPPGFGAPVPEGFGATWESYRDWLVAELESIGEPVDLVGHDWGGGHVVNVALIRPDLLRTWTSDVVGVYDPEYVWHDLAKLWQAPGTGEQVVDSMMAGSVAERAAGLESMGVSHDVAMDLASGMGPEMGRCVLSLYRSAPESVMRELGEQLPAAAARPGLAVLAAEDHYVGSPEMRRRAAARADARVEELPGLGHWWMLQDPRCSAQMLTDFWASAS
ncbi:alpha/beta fold hydrolase [Actinopolymorpha pittospori]|uniref:Pimeloyl-ACP methyl ester carboxylesterase n=1 Tax=Actinopolymorpha pittospori TaxID=648752 RepID=A0A927N2V1_9ACTN|nr:alpha/beta hydrolase [Actinopolymorpha pittospori]MBE1609283.1 pimeloyl-ACP methyl ester carboxylesterase [Actinopolymorpha pittospori]